MKEARQNIEMEFSKAYEELSDAIFRHCFFRVSDREVALDLVQETFFKVWRSISSGSQVENMKALLFKTASNLIIDYYRKKKNFSLDEMWEEDGFDPSGENHMEIEKEAEWSVVKRVLNKLDEKHREVMILRYVDGFSVGEVAEILGENENVVSVRLHRATAKAKEIFNDEK